MPSPTTKGISLQWNAVQHAFTVPRLPLHNQLTRNTTVATPSRASLFGLPRELRLTIYDTLITHEVHYDLGTLDPNVLARLTAPTRPRRPFRTPTTPLALSCRSIANEIRSHANTLQPAQSTAIVELAVNCRGYYRVLLRTFPCRVQLLRTLRIDSVMSNVPQDNLFANPSQFAYAMARQLTLGACALFECKGCALDRAEGIAEVEVLVICAGLRARDCGNEVEFGQLLQDVIGSTVVDTQPAGAEGSRALRLRPIK